ncbi:MAG: zf-HC2 domain-containing protein [Acidobacteriia bacterium]|nr:zf-HC2 domain-containing protein [Terriglobia bacterium]
MDCRQCNDDLTAYIDGELADSTADEMSRHLEKCRPCHDEYQDLRDSAVFVVSHTQELEPVPEIWNNLRSRIAEMPAPADAFGFFRFLVVNRWAAATATLAATLILALGLWGYMQYQQSQNELETYMNDYIQMRTITERLHTLQLMEADNTPPSVETAAPGSVENPFADIRPVSYSNPFRSEER